MASTRELWILLRARDEASRVVSSFSKNVRAAALAAQAAQKSAEAAAIRQQAQVLKTNGATAQQIRAINENVVALEKQARAQTLAAATARERRAEMMAAIGSEVKANNQRAANLERQARALTLASSMADEHRQALIRVTGATDENVAAIDAQISSLRKRAATLNAEAAVYRGNSNSLIAQVEKESVGLENSIRSYERRAAAIRAQAAILRNQAAEQKINLDNQVRVLTKQAQALDKQANALRQSAIAAREHDNKVRKLTQNLGKMSEAATVAAFSLGAIGVGGLVGLKQAIDTTVEYDRQVRATATQVDGFKANLEELGDIGRRVANEIAVPFESIQPALFDIFSSMEVSMGDAEKLLKAFSKAAVAGQVEIQDVSRATIGLLNAFGRPAKDVNKILDMQFQLIQEGVGTYEEWNQRIGLVTPSAVRAGQSIEMMMAALATATRMGMSAARSGTSVARAMDAMSHPAAVKNMEQLGIKVRDARGKFLPMNEVLRDFRTALMKMPEKKRLQAILDVFKGAGGTIEARRFIQNILLGKGNLELFDQVLKETSNSAGSMEKAYGIMADGTAAKSELLRNKWQLLKDAIGTALLPAFNDLIDRLSKVLDWFNKLPKSTKNTIAQFILWGSVISIVLGGMFAFVGVAAVFIAAIGTIGTSAALALTGLALLPVAILAIGAAFVTAYKKSEEFRSTVDKIVDNVKKIWDSFAKTGESIKTSIETHILPPLKRLWSVIENEVAPTVRKWADAFEKDVIPKIEEANRIIRDFADGALKRIGEVIDNTVIPAVERLAKWWKENESTLRPMIGMLGQLVKWLLILAAIITGVIIVVFVGPLIAAVTLAVGAFQLFMFVIVTITNRIKELWSWIQQLWGLLEQFGTRMQAAFAQALIAAIGFFTQIGTWFQELPGRIMGFIQSIPARLQALFMQAFLAAAYAIGFGVGMIYRFFSEIVPTAIGFLVGLPARLGAIFMSAFTRAAVVVGTGVARVLAFFNALPLRAAVALSRLWGAIQGHFSRAVTGAQQAGTNLVNGFIRTVQQAPQRAGATLRRVHGAVMGAFAGAGMWLFSAGQNIIQGVINGIGSMIGGAVNAARNAAQRMVKGFQDALSIKSPSRVFRDIGYNIIRGLINGITGTRKQLMDAMARIARDVQNSLKEGGASSKTRKAWADRLTKTSKALLSLESRRAAINKQIASHQARLNDLLKARADLQKKITEKLSEAADITNLQGSSPAQLKKNLGNRLKALQDFSYGLTQLRARGLSAASVAELAEAGVDQAGGLVKTLMKADPGDLAEINRTQDQIRKIAGETGNKIAGQMYDAGINAAKGLIAGLQKQSSAITREMTKIANALISAIKKSLGIKSPSKVFEGIGINTALGYINGYRKQMGKVPLHAEMIAMGARSGTLARMQGQPIGSVGGRTFNQTVNVYTNEIDPRLHAAQLGFELEGRLR